MSVLPCFEGCGLWSRKFGEVNDFHYVQEDVYGLSNNWIGNLASQGNMKTLSWKFLLNKNNVTF